MPNLKFKIIPICYQNASQYSKSDVDFLLEKDNWNDMSFCTTYHLHSTPKINNSTTTTYLGAIHIMHIGQREYESGILGDVVEFNNLSEEHCSLCQDLDVYIALNRMLTIEQRKDFASSLRLILDIKTPWYEKFSNEECFEKSFLRYGSIEDSYALKRGKMFLFDENRLKENLSQSTLSFKFGDCDDMTTMNFRCSNISEDDIHLPNGIIAFIGRNGCGKSTLLYRIARWLYSNSSGRKALSKEISITPSDLGIVQLMLISYSAFDNFSWPWITPSDCQIYANSDNLLQDRFVYCGLRDSKKEAKDEFEETRKKNISSMDESYFLAKGRKESTVLKTQFQLAEEFVKALDIIQSDKTKRELFESMIRNCRYHNQELQQLLNELNSIPVIFEQKECIDRFVNLSTGHKFFLHSIAHIFAYLQEDSIVLFDEPENHLQPHLLSFMTKWIRIVAKERKCVVLYATHSPVILQNLMSSSIFIVRRNGNRVNLSHPPIQTFGANFGSINTTVFDLNTDATTFRSTMDYLFDKHCRKDMNPEKASEHIESILGCDLSPQMDSYIMSCCTGQKDS